MSESEGEFPSAEERRRQTEVLASLGFGAAVTVGTQDGPMSMLAGMFGDRRENFDEAAICTVCGVPVPLMRTADDETNPVLVHYRWHESLSAGEG